jgi:hypothetical protein
MLCYVVGYCVLLCHYCVVVCVELCYCVVVCYVMELCPVATRVVLTQTTKYTKP